MPDTLISNLTLITNFLCMAISLWFAIYILARSQANPLTFRAVVALLSLAFYYNNSFLEMVDPGTNTGAVRSLSLQIALIAAHDLTHYLLPSALRERLYWVARGIVLLGVVSIILLFTAPPVDGCNPAYICPSNLGYPWVVVDFFKFLFAMAILYNLWLIKRGGGWLLNVPFYLAVMLAAATIGYGFLGTAFNLTLPRFVPNIIMLFSLSLLVYSAAVNKTFISRRASTYELPITMMTIGVSVGVYVLFARGIGLTPTNAMLLAVLAILTHSSYDFIREFLERLFRRQEHQLRQEFRDLGRDVTSDGSSRRFLQRGLAILCHQLQATSGLIALSQGEGYEVVASLHALPVGSLISSEELRMDQVPQRTSTIKGQSYRLVRAGAGTKQEVLIGIGARKNKIPFGEEDIAWVEDIGEEISLLASGHRRKGTSAPAQFDAAPDATPVEAGEEMETAGLLSTLAYKLDPQLVKCVEEGFRNLNDYSRLGKSQLASLVSIEARDHVERGKLVQQMLTDTLENLRPLGVLPPEPLPREWYAYTILHDAYVEERLTREIMAKLYISEGTYFRLRRRALRGVTRTLLETGAFSPSI